ncbi:alpha/beta hydrolase [Tessaracoccus rhinocerotis]|uniref:Alpha/beta hydrolase n=1 Tax=Tessaracoccus rhinocerotis TaxID=1689449 RepID=A0A553K468_9ACTN|nr:alpha/beta hydrolase [Tessaracoccus rhinocerotis]TRY19495.1 alpha/beta hydrolase [Tessaracoccus rhinocerotis]
MTDDAPREPLNVHRFGNPDAPPLVLVHGLTDDGTNWPDAVFRWSFHWDIHAPDQRGHGHSPRFTREEVTDSQGIWVADLLELLRGLEQPAVLVGHSLGGLVCLRAALDEPDLVRALVLEDPAAPTDTDAADAQFVAHQQRFLAAFPEHTHSEIGRMRAETPWSETEILAWAQSKALVDPLMVEQGLLLRGHEWAGLFEQLTVPTMLVLPGDGGMGPDAADYDNPLVERVEVPGAGHCVRRDRPEAFHEAVDAFLAAHRRSV